MIRVRVEIVPHGVESQSRVLDEVLIENDGTGYPRGGRNDGGVGNYNVYGGETIDHLRGVDYPSMYALGKICGVPRDENHRLFLAGRAIEMVREHVEEYGRELPPGVSPRVLDLREGKEGNVLDDEKITEVNTTVTEKDTDDDGGDDNTGD